MFRGEVFFARLPALLKLALKDFRFASLINRVLTAKSFLCLIEIYKYLLKNTAILISHNDSCVLFQKVTKIYKND